MIDRTTASFFAQLSDVLANGLPCDEWAIADLEKQLGIRLPASYKAFLLLAGRGWEPLEGSQYAVDDDLAQLQRFGKRIFSKNHGTLPDNAFVFFVHQGFACQFFLLDDGDDPSIFQSVVGQGAPNKVYPHFSDWLSAEAKRSQEFRAKR
jgi:hypothetical protein